VGIVLAVHLQARRQRSLQQHTRGRQLAEASAAWIAMEPYPDLDQLAEVSDGTLLDRLNGELLRKIREDDRDRLWLAVPDFVDWARVGFRYSPASYDPYPDLDLEDFLARLRHREAMTLEGRRVYCVDLATDVEIESWPLVRCLHTEIVLGDKTYGLSNGHWYQVAQDFVARIAPFLRSRAPCGTSPSSSNEGHHRGWLPREQLPGDGTM
jgi:uncharacterized protein (TIGR04141 family)